MAGGKAPIIEVVIRDEISRALEQQRQKMSQAAHSATFRPLQEGLAGLQRSVGALRREFTALLSITGVGAFLGGGFVAGIAKATQAVNDLARSSIQTRYTAEALGMTVTALDRLTVRGMALGQSQAEAAGQIKNLTEALKDMQVQGTKSAQWQRLLKGRGGAQLGRELMQAFRTGGTEASARLLAERMEGMADSGVRALTQMFGLGLGFRDMFKIPQSELAEIFNLSEPEARKFALSMANLNISYQNVKLQLAQALMPALERMTKVLDDLLRGPLGGIVREFGTWLKSLNIDWDGIAKGITSVLTALSGFFSSMISFIQTMDPEIQKIGGWGTVIAGLVGVLGVAGLAGRLGGIAVGLTMIGNAAWVVPLLGAVAFASAGTGGGAAVPTPRARPQSAPGGRSGGMEPLSSPMPHSTGPGGIIQLPTVNVPGKRSSLGNGGAFDPENAAPYRVAGGWQPVPRGESDTSELRAQVSEVRTQVAALAGYVSSQAALTDESGAGSIAGFAGAIRSGAARTAPGGGGGGAPRRGGGGGAPRRGGGPRRAPASTSTTNVPRSTSTPTTTDEEFRIKGGRIPTPEERADTSRPVGLRKNNPFNMWHDKWAAQQGGVPGQRTSQYDVGALFPSLKAGAAAAIRKMLESQLYGGRQGGATIEQVIQTWVDPTGRRRGYGIEAARAAGVSPNTVMTREFLLSDAGLRFLHYMSRLETSWQHGNPLSDDDMKEARDAALRIRRPGSQADPPAQQPNTAADPKVPGADPQPNTPAVDDGTTRVQQSQLGQRGRKYRYNPIDPRLEAIFDESAIAAGVAKVNVESGGQGHIHKGSRRHNIDPRTGGGLAADFDLLDERGNLIGRRDPRYLKFLEEIVARGAGGTGVGYMGGARIHAGLTGAAGIIGQGLSLYSGGTRAEIEAYNRGLRRYYADKPELAAILQRTLERRAGGGEKKRQEQAQRDFDEWLTKQGGAPSSDTEGPGFMLPKRRRDRMSISVNLNLRGPRGVRARIGDSSDGVTTTINREMDPSGGITGHSPG
jgi:hypothetical protein